GPGRRRALHNEYVARRASSRAGAAARGAVSQVAGGGMAEAARGSPGAACAGMELRPALRRPAGAGARAQGQRSRSRGTAGGPGRVAVSRGGDDAATADDTAAARGAYDRSFGGAGGRGQTD